MYQEIKNLVRAKNYEKAEMLLKQVLASTVVTDYRLMVLYIDILLHTQRHDEAEEIMLNCDLFDEAVLEKLQTMVQGRNRATEEWRKWNSKNSVKEAETLDKGEKSATTTAIVIKPVPASNLSPPTEVPTKLEMISTFIKTFAGTPAFLASIGIVLVYLFNRSGTSKVAQWIQMIESKVQKTLKMASI